MEKWPDARDLDVVQAEFLDLLQRLFDGELAVRVALDAEREAAERVVLVRGERERVLERPGPGRRPRGGESDGDSVTANGIDLLITDQQVSGRREPAGADTIGADGTSRLTPAAPPCPAHPIFLTASLTAWMSARTSSVGSSSLASYSMLIRPCELHVAQRLSSAGMSGALAGDHFMGRLGVVVPVLEVDAEVAGAHLVDFLHRVELLAELGGADQMAGVQASSDKSIMVLHGRQDHVGRVPAVQVVALRPVRMDANGDLVFVAQLVQAVEAVRVGVGAEHLQAERLAQLEVLAVLVRVLAEFWTPQASGVTSYSLHSFSTAASWSGVESSGTCFW